LIQEKQGVSQMRSRLAIIVIGMGILLSFPQWSDAQWVSTNGPGGGHITALAVNGPNLFAGTFGGGSIHEGLHFLSIKQVRRRACQAAGPPHFPNFAILRAKKRGRFD